MNKTIKDFSLITMMVLSLTFLIWIPHFLAIHSFFGLDFSNGFNTIYRNFDSLEYVIVAKSFYSNTSIYYASHFPLYPLLILIFSFLGFLKSMLFVSLIFTILSSFGFYLLVKDFSLTKQPLLLTGVFLLLPARWLVVHSIGSPEPIFSFFVIFSIYSLLKFDQNLTKGFWIWICAASGLFAQLTRSPGILLFISYLLYVHWRMFQRKKEIGAVKAFREHLNYAPLALIPLGLLGVFFLFGQTYGDFFAYFHSGDNIHLTFPPFQVFNKHQYWVGDIWLEDIVFLLIFGFLGGITLIKQRLYPIGFLVLTFTTAAVFVAHRDLSRYILPVMPFVLIAFEKVLVSRELKIVLAIVGLGIYLYAQNFIINNVAPIPNPALYN